MEPQRKLDDDQRRRRSDLKHATYIAAKQGEIEIAFKDCNLGYLPEEIDRFVTMWNEGCHIADIMDTIERPDIETEILALYLSFKGKIKPRPGAVWGCG